MKQYGLCICINYFHWLSIAAMALIRSNFLIEFILDVWFGTWWRTTMLELVWRDCQIPESTNDRLRLNYSLVPQLEHFFQTKWKWKHYIRPGNKLLFLNKIFNGFHATQFHKWNIHGLLWWKSVLMDIDFREMNEWKSVLVKNVFNTTEVNTLLHHRVRVARRLRWRNLH